MVKTLIPTVSAAYEEPLPDNKKTITGATLEEKVRYVADLWGRDTDKYARQFVTACVNNAKNSDHCIMWGSSIALHESCAGKCSNAFFGVLTDRHQTYEYQIKRWVERYNKNKWYLRNTPSSWINGKYCVSTTNCPERKVRVGELVAEYDARF